MILVIDNFDSFTYNLVAYLKELGQKVEVKNNLLPPDQFNLNKYKGVVLSPGPSLPKDAGVANNTTIQIKIMYLNLCKLTVIR